jgi:hypothetical protein
MQRRSRVVGASLLAAALLGGLLWYITTSHSGTGSSSASDRTETWQWPGTFGPPQAHRWTQLVFGSGDQFPRTVEAAGPIHVTISMKQGSDLSNVMVLAGDQHVTPAMRPASDGGSYTFDVPALASGCATPILVYVRGADASPPQVVSAQATVTYSPPSSTTRCPTQ